MRKYNQSNDLNRPIKRIILATCATLTAISGCGKNQYYAACNHGGPALHETNSALGSRIDKTFLIAKPMRKVDWTRRFAAGWGSAGVPGAIVWGGQTVRSAPARENDREITAGARSGIVTASFRA